LETVEALRKQGHECVEFQPPDVPHAIWIFNSLVSADGFTTLLSHLQGDPREPSLFLVTLGPRLPGFLRTFAGWVLERFIGDPIFGNLIKSSRTKSVTEYLALAKERDAYIQRFNQQVWDAHGFDGLICPPQASPAVPHNGTTFLASMAAATILYNLVDSPAGIVPVTRVDRTKDALTPSFWSATGHGSKLWEDKLYKGSEPVYNPDVQHGLPVGVQIVGRLWEDEKVVEMMKVVDKALGERGFGPGMKHKIDENVGAGASK
jgi:amidase